MKFSIKRCIYRNPKIIHALTASGCFTHPTKSKFLSFENIECHLSFTIDSEKAILSLTGEKKLGIKQVCIDLSQRQEDKII